jgi:hypothetical protein
MIRPKARTTAMNTGRNAIAQFYARPYLAAEAGVLRQRCVSLGQDRVYGGMTLDQPEQ